MLSSNAILSVNLMKPILMTTAAIRQKLYEYIRIADEKKVKAIFTMVEDELKDFDWVDDKDFMAELDKRSSDYKSGKVKGIAWEDAKKRILAKEKKK
jgi:putative addiction module component (TIGR02574 family)